MSTFMLAIPGALLVGFSLGMLGSGGSILTVPVLVYVLGQDEKIAIASSLAIVGAISLIGSFPYIFRRMVDWRMVLFFGLPGVVGTWLGAWASVLVSGAVQLAVFAAVMVAAAYLMIRPASLTEVRDSSRSVAVYLTASEGLGVGALTGFVGVGGGFLIVPALVLLGGIQMHRAIATSLVIIALKSFAGFAKYVDVLSGEGIDLPVIVIFSLLGIGGSFLGGYIAPRIHQDRLKRGFGGVLVVMGLFILYRTVPTLMG